MKYRLVLTFLIAVFIGSCGNKEAEKRAEKIKEEKLSVPQNVTQVSAVGRIEPEAGLIDISSENGGIVLKVLKTTGDSVKKGEAIVILKAATEKSNEEVIRNQIRSQEARVQADQASVAQYSAQLKEMTDDLAVSERLVKTGAETQQNVEIKKKDLDVLKANLNAAKKNVDASRADIAVLTSQLREAQIGTSNRTITAPENGILVSNDAKPGSAISAFTSFATLAPSGPLVVHGEIDEMFASSVALGDRVSVNYPGTGTVISNAHITFLSPVLSDKSLFYDVAGESSDRRVRRFKAELENAKGLLINEKVECTILLQ